MAMQGVDAKTVKEWLDKKEALLLDVREPVEHAAEKIGGAHLYPLSQMEKLQLPDQKAQKLVLHCRSGKRSAAACQKLLKHNPGLDVYNLEGGIMAWAQSGYPVERANGFSLPLEQQVQLSVGTLILLTSMLAWLLSPVFLVLTALLGLGLIFAGISGHCGLAYVLAQMPWNKSNRNCVSCRKT
ncbi:rhodanese-like domain-containing protein [Legionella jordanis]|uniref:Rhodanese domain protein n=1 Tax=Legionella jordanis TaxID=456 RepID=A0A0W0VA56_9GAMM|nr:rhodanese-like domain-containing protein [Legionella jordanis]KTD16948.1 Rhodanese domain protein [Legionella jordanis]RMX03093.1 DUF2892 domain-containing protein [Legionella jordanis]VEH12858.1 rhodanese domain-containing protein [Legionella jordanis]